MFFRNLQLFNDAFDLANVPPPNVTETQADRIKRYSEYFTTMTARYGSRWLDIFLDEPTTFQISDPQSFAFQFLSKLILKVVCTTVNCPLLTNLRPEFCPEKIIITLTLKRNAYK